MTLYKVNRLMHAIRSL